MLKLPRIGRCSSYRSSGVCFAWTSRQLQKETRSAANIASRTLTVMARHHRRWAVTGWHGPAQRRDRSIGVVGRQAGATADAGRGVDDRKGESSRARCASRAARGGTHRPKLWTIDLSDAYRILVVHYSELWPQKFVWLDGVRLDARCVFGAAHMVGFFQRLSRFVLRVSWWLPRSS